MKLKITKQMVYAHFGLSRQAAFKAIARFKQQTKLIEQIRPLVKEYRKNNDARAGSRSLFYNLDIRQKFGLGVNRFERLLSEEGLALKPLKIRRSTTKSSVLSQRYENLTFGLKLNGINQLVVGDLTYLTNIDPFNRWYLFCLTDAYSGRWVGFCLSKSMRTEDALVALEMWVELRLPESNLHGCIHHTDGGGQYFSELYLKRLSSLEIRISKAGNCFENGLAEQRNGFIKQHLLPTFKGVTDPRELQKQFRRIMHIYNERKQAGLGWRSPVEFEAWTASLPEDQRLVITMPDFASKTLVKNSPSGKSDS